MLRTAVDEKITPHIPVSDMGPRSSSAGGTSEACRTTVPASGVKNGKLPNSQAPRTARLSHPQCIS